MNRLPDNRLPDNRMHDSRHAAGPGAWSGAAPKLSLIAALALTLGVALSVRASLPPQWLAPMVTTVMFAAAAVAGLCALRSARGSGGRAGWLDLAGIMTGIGIVLALLVDAEDAAQFVESMTRRD